MAELLDGEFGIGHATVQIEVEGGKANEMYCAMRSADEDHTGEDHVRED